MKVSVKSEGRDPGIQWSSCIRVMLGAHFSIPLSRPYLFIPYYLQTRDDESFASWILDLESTKLVQI